MLYVVFFVPGIATTTDVAEMNVKVGFIGARESELEAAVVTNQQKLTQFVKNLTAYSKTMKDVLEHDFEIINQRIEEKAETTYRNEACLGQIVSTNLKNQYLVHITSLMDSAYADCR